MFWSDCTFVGPFCWYFIIIMFHGDLMGFKRNPAVLNWNGTHVISIHIRVTIQCSVESSLPTLNFWQGLCELESWSVLIWHSNIPSISHKIFSNISQANKEKKQWNIKSQYSPTTCPTISPCFAGYIPQTSWKNTTLYAIMFLLQYINQKQFVFPLHSHFIPWKTFFFLDLLCPFFLKSPSLSSIKSSHSWLYPGYPGTDDPVRSWPLNHNGLLPKSSFSSFNPIISPSRFPQRATFFHPLTHGLLGIPHD